MKIWAKTKEWAEGKFLVVRRDGSVPHWPHFVLGARDPFAPAALLAYAEAYFQAGGKSFDKAYYESIVELAQDFDDYRAKHGVGDPEAPPHRTDNVDVIWAMRGKIALIRVVPDNENMAK